VKSESRAFVWCGRPRALGLGTNLLRSSLRRILLRILRQAWGTTRGPRCFRGLRSRFLPPSHLAQVPTSPTGPRPQSRTRMLVHQEASATDFAHLRTNRGSFTSVELHRSQPRVKDTQRQPTITFPSPRSPTRSSTTSRTLTLQPARDPLSNQRHHRPCTIPMTITIRPLQASSRIRLYPRYQVLLRVTPLPSSTIAAINF
jgi:hypothetical protein